MDITSNELKKGDMVMLNNGWKARIEDNKKGNIRLATVYGLYTEMGSVYAHDIGYRIADGAKVVPTAGQAKVKKLVDGLFGD